MSWIIEVIFRVAGHLFTLELTIAILIYPDAMLYRTYGECDVVSTLYGGG